MTFAPAVGSPAGGCYPICAETPPVRLAKIFLLAFITGLSGALMPGPLLAMTIGQVSLTGSWLVVPLMMAGHAALEIVVVGLLIAGLVQVLRSRWPRGIMSLAGGAVLLWMGYGMLHSAGSASLGPGSTERVLSAWGLVLAGAAVSALNPTFLPWWATVGAGGLAQVAPRTIPEYLSFYLGHELSDFGWYGIVGLALISGRGFLSPRVYGALVLLCGAAVIVLALWFMYTGVQVLRGRPEKEPKHE